jgi:4-hydroxy-tetrahydrodipicolinate reductase
MKLAIVGYGKMGRLIEQLAGEFGFEVALKLDIDNNVSGAGITAENFRDIDVAIEFSTPDTVVENIERISALGVGLVVGATGWYDQLPRVRAAVERAGSGLIYSPNFSVGVQVFSCIVETAARLLRDEADYDAWAYEIHHKMKKDAPSGTLLKLVEEMKRAGYARPIDTGSNRAGKHPGTHEIGFDSAADTITLRHTARSREGLARGALTAAQWVVGKKGFFQFSEILFGQHE